MDTSLIDEYRSKVSNLTAPSSPSAWEQYNRLLPLAELFKRLDTLEKKISQARELVESSDDQELLQLAKDDLRALGDQIELLQKDIIAAINTLESEPDDTDSRNAIIEIRPGPGGEEATLFAGDLFRMYSQFAQKRGWTVEILNQHLSDTGGIKEVIAKVSGENAFGTLKHESGVHRVQRIPVTESSGRIHTSTASVAVMPEARDIDVEITPEDIQIDTYRSSGAGGQHVNKTESAIRITHLPTGIVVTCQESRSQLKNRETAMSLLRSRLYEKELQEQQSKRASLRKEQIGSAMRAEKIRTYNFPQSRITDHRIKKSWHNLDTIMDGDLDAIIEELSKTTTA